MCVCAHLSFEFYLSKSPPGGMRGGGCHTAGIFTHIHMAMAMAMLGPVTSPQRARCARLPAPGEARLLLLEQENRELKDLLAQANARYTRGEAWATPMGLSVVPRPPLGGTLAPMVLVSGERPYGQNFIIESLLFRPRATVCTNNYWKFESWF